MSNLLLRVCRDKLYTVMPECHCARLPDEYPGSGVRQLAAVAWSVDTLSCDPRHWVRFLRCRECGQLWEEYHVATGHGENANTRKVHMDAYETLARMAKESGTTAEDRRRYLWCNAPWLAETVRRELSKIVEGAFLERTAVHVDDPSYRQSATAVVFDFRFDVADPFTIGVRCLLDHQSISVRVARAPQSATFDRARSVIEQKTAASGDVPLSEL